MSAPGESVVCPSCGTSIKASARFCESCGSPQGATGWVDPAEVETAIQGADVVAAAAPIEPGDGDVDIDASQDRTARLWAGDPAAAADAPPTTDAFCAQCGRAYPPGAQFCVACGTKRGGASEPAQPPPAPPPPQHPPPAQPPPPQPPPAPQHAPRSKPPDWQQHLPAPFDAIPLELLAAYLLTTIAGSLTLYPAIRVLPDIADLLGESGFAEQVGLLSLTVWAVLGLTAIALIFLAWRMVHRDPVAHGLAVVLLGGLAGSVVIGNAQPTELVLAMLAAFAAIAVLSLTPEVKAFFAAAHAPREPEPAQQPEPLSIVMARTLVAIWAAVITFVGVMFLPLRDLGGKYLPIGIMFIALGVAAWIYNTRIARRDPAARAVVTTAAGVYLVLLLVLGERHPGLLLPLALATGIVVSLWVPSESQQYFAETPI